MQGLSVIVDNSSSSAEEHWFNTPRVVGSTPTLSIFHVVSITMLRSSCQGIASCSFFHKPHLILLLEQDIQDSSSSSVGRALATKPKVVRFDSHLDHFLPLPQRDPSRPNSHSRSSHGSSSYFWIIVDSLWINMLKDRLIDWSHPIIILKQRFWSQPFS